MTRAADHTRKALLGAATNVFAEFGYDRGSIREIARWAEANQAAITYHFGGKNGLYIEVLKLAVAAFADSAELTPEKVSEMDGPEALPSYPASSFDDHPASQLCEISENLRLGECAEIHRFPRGSRDRAPPIA